MGKVTAQCGVADAIDTMIEGFMQSASDGDAAMLSIFLDCGMPPQITDRHGKTAIYYAELNGQSEITQILQRALAIPHYN